MSQDFESTRPRPPSGAAAALPLWVRLRGQLGSLLVLLLFVGTLWLLRRELQQHSATEIWSAVEAIAVSGIAASVLWTIVNYMSLAATDFVAIQDVGKNIPPRHVVLASCLGYAVGNSFGPLLGGATIRVRLYGSWGLSSAELIRVVVIVGLTFWCALCALAGVLFVTEPIELPAELHMPTASTLPLGLVLLALAIGYLLLAAFRRQPFRLGRLRLQPPSLRIALLQMLVGAIDLVTAAAALYVLLPDSFSLGFWAFLPLYLLAVTAGLVSHVPGGLGVLELVLLLLVPDAETEAVIGSLLVYRLIYYLMPLVVGLAVLAGHELQGGRGGLDRMWGAAGRWAEVAMPPVVAVMVFFSGAMLLFSGALPWADARTAIARQALPLPLVELSHLLSSACGAALLVLAQGLRRRSRRAFRWTLGLLLAGVLLTLLKGLQYEESLVLMLLLLLMLPCRRHFCRRDLLSDPHLSPGWTAAIAIVMATAIWLSLYSYQHVQFSEQMWWRFAYRNDAPRSLRADAAAAAVLTGMAIVGWLRRRRRRREAERASS